MTQSYIKSLLLSSEYAVQLKSVSLKVELGMGIRTHFCFKCPMNSCSPMRAKTLKQKTVRIITSASFFTDWNNAPTIVFRPARYTIVCYTFTFNCKKKEKKTLSTLIAKMGKTSLRFKVLPSFIYSSSQLILLSITCLKSCAK